MKDVSETQMTKWKFALIGPTLILTAMIAVLYHSWNMWADVLSDFGRELYVPWALSQGRVLYSDIAYHRGPLSPYWNALCFYGMGVSIRTLVISNIAVLSSTLILLYWIIRRFASRVATTVACLIFVTVFASSQCTFLGSYNYVCPYSHEVTHGLLLSLAAIACVLLFQQFERSLFLTVSGFALGLVFLTKPEFFVAAFASVATALAGLIYAAWPCRRKAVRMVLFTAAGMPIGPAIAVALLSLVLPLADAWQGMLGSWPIVFDSDLLTPFQRWVMGFDDTGNNTRWFLIYTVGYAIVFSAMWRLSTAFDAGSEARTTAVLLCVFILVVGFVGSRALMPTLQHILRPLPLILSVVAGVMLLAFVRKRQPEYIAALTMLVFALALLSRMVLRVWLGHYGFSLAMPATLLLVVLMVDWIPALIEKRGGQHVIFRAGSLGLLTVIALWTLNISSNYYAQKHVKVATQNDTLNADVRGEYVNAALSWLLTNSSPGETMAAMPQGQMLNYLARQANPTPYGNTGPFEVNLWGEQNVLRSLQETSPDIIILVHDDYRFFARFFGQDYGQAIMGWVRENYTLVRQIGEEPFTDRGFGIVILKSNQSRDLANANISIDAKPE